MDYIFELTCQLQGFFIMPDDLKPEYFNLSNVQSYGFYKTEENAITSMVEIFKKDIEYGPIISPVITNPLIPIEKTSQLVAYSIPRAERSDEVWLCVIMKHALI